MQSLPQTSELNANCYISSDNDTDGQVYAWMCTHICACVYVCVCMCARRCIPVLIQEEELFPQGCTALEELSVLQTDSRPPPRAAGIPGSSGIPTPLYLK